MFDKATVVNNVKSEAATDYNVEGLLIISVVNRKTGVKQTGTVCKNTFDWHSAKLVCRSLGYVFADWGGQRISMKHVSQYVSLIHLQFFCMTTVPTSDQCSVITF